MVGDAAEGVLAGFYGCVARDSWIIPIHGWLRSLVDPVTRLVEENPRVGWANKIEKGEKGY